MEEIKDETIADTRERMTRVLIRANMTLNRFARTIGAPLRAPELRKAMSGKGPLAPDLVDLIVNTYPDINREWLLTGKGDMYLV